MLTTNAAPGISRDFYGIAYPFDRGFLYFFFLSSVIFCSEWLEKISIVDTLVGPNNVVVVVFVAVFVVVESASFVLITGDDGFWPEIPSRPIIDSEV